MSYRIEGDEILVENTRLEREARPVEPNILALRVPITNPFVVRVEHVIYVSE